MGNKGEPQGTHLKSKLSKTVNIVYTLARCINYIQTSRTILIMCNIGYRTETKLYVQRDYASILFPVFFCKKK